MKRLSISVLLCSFFLCTSNIVFASSYSYVTIDFPGTESTFLTGINNYGQISGYFSGYQETSFMFDGKTFWSFTDIDGFNRYAYDINDSGQIVGRFPNYNSNSWEGFILEGRNFTEIGMPGHDLFATAINNSGQIVGFNYTDNKGFLYDEESMTAIEYPGAAVSYANGINDNGQIVGQYWLTLDDYYWSDKSYGYLLDGGNFISIVFPEAYATMLTGINNNGEIVGMYRDSPEIGIGETHGFLFDGEGFDIINIPGATDTMPLGINDQGQIVGYYFDPSGVERGFLATPVPLPGAVWLFGSGLFCLLGVRKRFME